MWEGKQEYGQGKKKKRKKKRKKAGNKMWILHVKKAWRRRKRAGESGILTGA